MQHREGLLVHGDRGALATGVRRPDLAAEGAVDEGDEGGSRRPAAQGCQMAKFDPYLSLDCARVEGVGRNPRKGRDQILQRSVAEP